MMARVLHIADTSGRVALHRGRQGGLIAALMSLLLIAFPASAFSQQHFDSPEQAVKALVAAAKANDRREVVKILGSEGRDIASSGDEVADDNARLKFVEAYDAESGIVTEGDKATLEIGHVKWPFPIPLVRQNGKWLFDAVAGRQEILARRIGRNERGAIQACLAYVDAQNEYARMNVQQSAVPVYAQRIISRPGKKDGLYWPAKQSEASSPLGELVANATSEGYRQGQRRTPYLGYYYKILKAQGTAAQGGVYDYVVRGKMIGGFALVAYPARYRNSGVMTFIVNHDGVVYQKDLGRDTTKLAARIQTFNPDESWTKVSSESLVSDQVK
jgi:hypothetical protein